MAPTSSHGAWVKNLLASLTAYSGIGYLATAYTISRWLTRTSPGVPQRSEELAGHEWLDVTCRTSDRLDLAGWVVSPPQPWGTIALFHGLRASRAQTLSRMGFLTRAGLRCVAFDHRGHGTSQGRWTSFGFFERRDVEAVFHFIQERWPEQPKIGLGISMGAAALCFAVSHGIRYDAFILESLYPRLTSAFHNRVGHGYPEWFRHFRTGVIWITEKRLGMKVEDAAPIEVMPRLAASPVLLVTGSDDAHSPVEEVKTLHQQAGQLCDFSVIQNADHGNLFEVGGDLYQTLVLDFLRRRLRATAHIPA